MLVASDYFFLALDDRTGRSRLSPKVFGLGLAGALLAELVLAERITIEGDRLRVVNRQPPADGLSHTILDHLLAESAAHPVRSWLVFLAQRSTEQVADRLWRAGHIRIETTRRLLNKETIYPPTDVNTAYWPTARLSNALGRGGQITWPDRALCGLAVATGLRSQLIYTGGTPAREYLDHIVAHLTPSLYALVWHLDAAVGDAVLTGRT